MGLFNKHKVFIWIKEKGLDIFFDREDNNVFNLEVNLFAPHTTEDLVLVSAFIKQYSLKECTILIGDDIVVTKSFIYDSIISSIDKKEVIGLAESFIPFPIDPDNIEYEIIPREDKTIIRATIYNKAKLDALKANLQLLDITAIAFTSVSTAISHVISGFYKEQYFLIYPISKNEFTFFLADQNKVYLTANLKGPSLDIQKLINYAQLYFAHPIKKVFVPANLELEINTTTEIEKTPYNEAQIAKDLKKASNLPLPILGLFSAIISVRINNSNPKPQKTMENKKNYLPIIAVFIVTAALASIIIWFIMNRNKTDINTPSAETTETIQEMPTNTPVPTVAEISKDLKIQVLNATTINGQAAIVKEMFTKLGFESVAVGNAKDATLTTNKISYKATAKGVKEYLTSKLTELPADYSADQKETSTYDIVVTIGTDLKTGSAPSIDEAKPTAKPTVKPTATTSATPTAKVTAKPTATVSATPTVKLTATPTSEP